MLPSVSSAAGKTVSASTFNTKYSTMAYLRAISLKGKGAITVILPDTKSSARYTAFDAPDLTKALRAAHVKRFKVLNALGSDSTMFTDAQAAIASGTKVLIVDPIDPTTGATIEAYARARGVKTIDYDRLTLGGLRSYYASLRARPHGASRSQ
jgi:D-xylose transport system substrate-binding protein